MTATSAYKTYYSAICCFQLTGEDSMGFEQTLENLLEEARSLDGFIADESVIDPQSASIFILYFHDQTSLNAWQESVNTHLATGKEQESWLSTFNIHLGKSIREYSFKENEGESA